MTDDVRRRDVGPPIWARELQGAAAVTHVEGRDNSLGLASEDLRPKDVISTEQGVVLIGSGPINDMSWHPTVADLAEAPYWDTRRTAISDRYFR